MGAVSAGSVIFVRFPFSDLSHSKLRPAIVLAVAGRGDYVRCQITSKAYGDVSAIEIAQSDFAVGALSLTSFVRPGKLFTANDSLIAGIVGQISKSALTRVVDTVVTLLRSGGVAR